MREVEPLTETQRSVLLDALADFADEIERVDLYGSRARGTHRPGSDVDLVLEGRVDAAKVGRIARAIDESRLSIFADVSAYGLLSDGTYRDEIRRTARLLFTHDDLVAAKQAVRNDPAT